MGRTSLWLPGLVFFCNEKIKLEAKKIEIFSYI